MSHNVNDELVPKIVNVYSLAKSTCGDTAATTTVGCSVNKNVIYMGQSQASAIGISLQASQSLQYTHKPTAIVHAQPKSVPKTQQIFHRFIPEYSKPKLVHIQPKLTSVESKSTKPTPFNTALSSKSNVVTIDKTVLESLTNHINLRTNNKHFSVSQETVNSIANTCYSQAHNMSQRIINTISNRSKTTIFHSKNDKTNTYNSISQSPTCILSSFNSKLHNSKNIVIDKTHKMKQQTSIQIPGTSGENNKMDKWTSKKLDFQYTKNVYAADTVSKENTEINKTSSVKSCDVTKSADSIEEQEAMDIAASLFIEPQSDSCDSPPSTITISDSDCKEHLNDFNDTELSQKPSSDSPVPEVKYFCTENESTTIETVTTGKNNHNNKLESEDESSVTLSSSSDDEDDGALIDSDDSEYDPGKEEPAISSDENSEDELLSTKRLKRTSQGRFMSLTTTSSFCQKNSRDDLNNLYSLSNSKGIDRSKMVHKDNSCSTYPTVVKSEVLSDVSTKKNSLPLSPTFSQTNEKINRLKLLKQQQQEALQRMRQKLKIDMGKEFDGQEKEDLKKEEDMFEVTHAASNKIYSNCTNQNKTMESPSKSYNFRKRKSKIIKDGDGNIANTKTSLSSEDPSETLLSSSRIPVTLPMYLSSTSNTAGFKNNSFSLIYLPNGKCTQSGVISKEKIPITKQHCRLQPRSQKPVSIASMISNPVSIASMISNPVNDLKIVSSLPKIPTPSDNTQSGFLKLPVVPNQQSIYAQLNTSVRPTTTIYSKNMITTATSQLNANFGTNVIKLPINAQSSTVPIQIVPMNSVTRNNLTNQATQLNRGRIISSNSSNQIPFQIVQKNTSTLPVSQNQPRQTLYGKPNRSSINPLVHKVTRNFINQPGLNTSKFTPLTSQYSIVPPNQLVAKRNGVRTHNLNGQIASTSVIDIFKPQIVISKSAINTTQTANTKYLTIRYSDGTTSKVTLSGNAVRIPSVTATQSNIKTNPPIPIPNPHIKSKESGVVTGNIIKLIKLTSGNNINVHPVITNTVSSMQPKPMINLITPNITQAIPPVNANKFKNNNLLTQSVSVTTPNILQTLTSSQLAMFLKQSNANNPVSSIAYSHLAQIPILKSQKSTSISLPVNSTQQTSLVTTLPTSQAILTPNINPITQLTSLALKVSQKSSLLPDPKSLPRSTISATQLITLLPKTAHQKNTTPTTSTKMISMNVNGQNMLCCLSNTSPVPTNVISDGSKVDDFYSILKEQLKLTIPISQKVNSNVKNSPNLSSPMNNKVSGMIKSLPVGTMNLESNSKLGRPAENSDGNVINNSVLTSTLPLNVANDRKPLPTPALPLKLGVKEKLFIMNNPIRHKKWTFLPNMKSKNFLSSLGTELCLSELNTCYYHFSRGGPKDVDVNSYFKDLYIKKKKRKSIIKRTQRLKKVIKVITSDSSDGESLQFGARVKDQQEVKTVLNKIVDRVVTNIGESVPYSTSNLNVNQKRKFNHNLDLLNVKKIKTEVDDVNNFNNLLEGDGANGIVKIKIANHNNDNKLSNQQSMTGEVREKLSGNEIDLTKNPADLEKNINNSTTKTSNVKSNNQKNMIGLSNENLIEEVCQATIPLSLVEGISENKVQSKTISSSADSKQITVHVKASFDPNHNASVNLLNQTAFDESIGDSENSSESSLLDFSLLSPSKLNPVVVIENCITKDPI